LKTAILVLALLVAGVGIADTASATCVMEDATLDPIEEDTGTPADKVVLHYQELRCNPI
jgi:hypothetical protein